MTGTAASPAQASDWPSLFSDTRARVLNRQRLPIYADDATRVVGYLAQP